MPAYKNSIIRLNLRKKQSYVAYDHRESIDERVKVIAKYAKIHQVILSIILLCLVCLMIFNETITGRCHGIDRVDRIALIKTT